MSETELVNVPAISPAYDSNGTFIPPNFGEMTHAELASSVFGGVRSIGGEQLAQEVNDYMALQFPEESAESVEPMEPMESAPVGDAAALDRLTTMAYLVREIKSESEENWSQYADLIRTTALLAMLAEVWNEKRASQPVNEFTAHFCDRMKEKYGLEIELEPQNLVVRAASLLKYAFQGEFGDINLPYIEAVGETSYPAGSVTMRVVSSPLEASKNNGLEIAFVREIGSDSSLFVSALYDTNRSMRRLRFDVNHDGVDDFVLEYNPDSSLCRVALPRREITGKYDILKGAMPSDSPEYRRVIDVSADKPETGKAAVDAINRYTSEAFGFFRYLSYPSGYERVGRLVRLSPKDLFSRFGKCVDVEQSGDKDSIQNPWSMRRVGVFGLLTAE